MMRYRSMLKKAGGGHVQCGATGAAAVEAAAETAAAEAAAAAWRSA